MILTRRFLFRGNASAFAGQIFRPSTIIIGTSGSSLGASGGRSESRIEGRSFGDEIRFGSALTSAEGLFDDERQARAVTNHKGRQEDLTSTTTVSAELRDLSVGLDPVFTVKRVRGSLVSRSPDTSGEPAIVPGTGTSIDGVEINGHALVITVNTRLFQKYDTRSKVVAAAGDPKFMNAFGVHLAAGATVEGERRQPGLVTRHGMIYTTVVSQIAWKGKPYPGATIDGHSMIVPNFGRVFFGELLVAGMERRLTMVRFELGSPAAGYLDGVDIGCNGSFYP